MRNQTKSISLFITTIALFAMVLPGSGAIVPAKLRCEYLIDPQGIDEQSPSLSWVVTSDQRGQRQTAYQIRVGSSPEQPNDLWDTGKAESAETVNIVYAGKPLQSRQQCFCRHRCGIGTGNRPVGALRPAGRWVC